MKGKREKDRMNLKERGDEGEVRCEEGKRGRNRRSETRGK